ncbi:MAG TPA: DNA/RNA helicase domain-containing protein, partial [Candidatus Paceibacterota bacterium]
MTQIQTFPFEKDKFDQLRSYHFGLNWPVVYIQENGTEMYIGQTTNVFSRSNQHYDNPDRARLKRIHVLTDEEFNMSAAYDFESLLIQYVSADGKYKLQNGNGGLINHNYYEKEKYLAKLETVWPQLQDKGLVKQNLKDIKNSEFFKYSPYKALTEDQLAVAAVLEKSIKKRQPVTHIVNGAPGTGKSILALYLLKHLKERRDMQDVSMALVVPMAGLRSTLQRVVRRVPGLGAEMIIGPSDIAKKEYDLLIVDETHRLSRRVNLAN